MTYSDAIDYLYGLEAARGWDLKLERVRQALVALGSPEKHFPSVLIAGTNGKGTTAAFVHAALVAAGYRVGLYTSPHLVHFTERIRIGHEEIDRGEFARGVERLRERLSPDRTGLTCFEVATLLALSTFAQEKVDVAVLEVGLGGRLDATNAVEPECSAITSIDLDHQSYLGDSFEEIAREKAGVMREGRVTVLGPVFPPAAAATLKTRAREVGAELVQARAFSAQVAPDAMRSASARSDAGVAAAVLDALAELRPELAVGRGDRDLAFAGVRWPGRAELWQGDPALILDGAHNVESTRALCAELPRLARGPVRLVFGAMEDKPWRQLASLLSEHVSEVVTVSVSQPRSVDPKTLSLAFAGSVPTRIGGDPFAEVERLAGESCGHPILTTGSLYLVGAVYAGLLAMADRSSVFDPDLRRLTPWRGSSSFRGVGGR